MEVAKSPKPKNKSRKKAEEVAAPPKSPAAAAAGAYPSAAEGDQQQQMEKSARYRHLWKEVGLLDDAYQNPGFLEAAFLEMDDDEAARLNNKITKQKMAECKVFSERWVIRTEVSKALFDTMKK